MLKRRPPNDLHQMLPQYLGNFIPVQNYKVSESARELLKELIKKIVERRSERIYIMIEVITYWKYGEIPENREIFMYGLKHIETK